MTLWPCRQAWNAFEFVTNPVEKTEEVRAGVKFSVVEMMNAGKLQPVLGRWGGLEELQAADQEHSTPEDHDESDSDVE